MTKTFQITISGQVQGVGFRPFVYQMAKKSGLKGTVCNTGSGVCIHVNAKEQDADAFLALVLENAPSISNIQFHTLSEVRYREYTDFKIVPSETEQQVTIPLTPDFAICTSCQGEIQDPDNRRYGYAFTTCTTCGPRYAVTTSFPFERKNTTISKFKMCQRCQAEYTDATDRRFHSQTNGCAACGIQLQLLDHQGKCLNGEPRELIHKTAYLLREGHILAIKNTTGYLLCCDARNPRAIANLRKRKQRPEKPFAVLYPNLDQVKRNFDLNTREEQALTSPVAPIVILNVKGRVPDVDQEGIAPGLNQLGVMLPSTGLLTLLMAELNIPIVATSGNIHGSPIISKNAHAIEKLDEVADYFLVHDLEISFPQDDSVVRFSADQQVTLRRSRGMAPNYMNHFAFDDRSVLAMGAHLKSTFAFAPNKHTYISPYFGNLDSYEVFTRYAESIATYEVLFSCTPQVVLIDSHPQYQSSILGRQLAEERKAQIVSVQHHKAHFASVLGEHDLFEVNTKVLGVVWDGTGYGEDQAIWGGEFFKYENGQMDRLTHFEYVEWLAADKMAREPRLSLLVMLSDADKSLARDKFSGTEWRIYNKVLETSDLKTSSVGRLFDAVASLLGLIDIASYEGQAAMLLESQAKGYQGEDLIDFLTGTDVTPTLPIRKLLGAILKAKMDAVPNAQIAASFIHTLALVIMKIATRSGYEIVACSGGVFQNALLVEKLSQLAKNKGIKLKFNRILSSNDENIAFGQLCYYRHLIQAST